MDLLDVVAVLSAKLHEECDKRTKLPLSRRACVLSAMIVRDVLQHAGFPAVVASVCLVNGDKVIGRAKPAPSGEWAGHAVVISSGYLIDPTSSQAGLPDMVCVPLGEKYQDAEWILTPENTFTEHPPERYVRERVVPALVRALARE